MAVYDDPLVAWFQKILPWTKRRFVPRPEDEKRQDEENRAYPPPPEEREHQLPVKSAPNISLNLHGGSKTMDLCLVAICGIVLQFGMLVFSGFSVYHPHFKMRFPKNGERVRPYAFPIMAVGTIILMIGMMICSAVVEQSTVENIFVPGKKYLETVPVNGQEEKLNARILWLQKNHVVSDQSFDSFVIFGRNQSDPRKCILTSQRTDPNAGSDTARQTPVSTHMQPVQGNCTPTYPPGDVNNSNEVTDTAPEHSMKRIFNIVSGLLSSTGTTSEKLTLVGVVLGLSGFILQFQGLRSMNWSASIAQLVCIALMTVFRAIVRRGLIITPIPKNVLDGHEMDWLALRIASNGSDFWPSDEQALNSKEERLRLDYRFVIQDSCSNRFEPYISAPCTQQSSSADTRSVGDEVKVESDSVSDAQQSIVADSLSVPNETESDSSSDVQQQNATDTPRAPIAVGIESDGSPAAKRSSWTILTDDQNFGSDGEDESRPGLGKAQHAMKVRQRLGMLTGWRSKISEPAIAVASSIDLVMNTLINSSVGNSVWCWFLKVRIDNRSPEYIKFKIEHTESEGTWKSDPTEIEAALSLWNFQIREMEAKNKDSDTTKAFKVNWLQHDVELRRQVIRALGPDTGGLRRYISWWIGDGIGLRDSTDNSARYIEEVPGRFLGPIGFFGSESSDQSRFRPKYDPAFRRLIRFSSDGSSLDHKRGVVAVNSEGPLEILLAQHMFTAFMWAIVKHDVSAMPPTFLHLREQTTIGHADVFKLDDPKKLLSFRLENKTLVGMANTIQQIGLGTVQDVYMCMIPSLSHTKRLPIAPLIDFVRREMKDYEVLGHWEKAIPVYVELFRICKTLEKTQHNSFHQATAIMIHIFLSFCNFLKLRMKQGRHGNNTHLLHFKDKILRELKPEEEQDSKNIRKSPSKLQSFHNLISNFATLYKIQGRLDLDMWCDLVPQGGEIGHNDVHISFQHPAVFSLIPTMNSWDVQDHIGNINARDTLGWTPLHYAALGVGGNESIISSLLHNGADPRAADLAEWTPLHYAIDTADKDCNLHSILWSYLEAGVDIEIRGRDGITPLHCAAKKGNIGATNLLLQAGLNIEIQDNSRMTPLHWAAYNGGFKVTELLLHKGAFLEARDCYGRTALHMVTASALNTNTKIEVIQLLADNNADINAKARDGSTALHTATNRGQEAVVRRLIDNGADKDARDSWGQTALHRAAYGGDEAIIRFLFEHHTDKDVKDNSGNTALHIAACSETTVRLLLELGFDKDASNCFGQTAFYIAVMNNDKAVVRQLLKVGADPDKDSGGWTPLHVAARNGDVDLVQLLIEQGVVKHAQDGGGCTSLHIAAEHGDVNVARLLLEHGADTEAQDNCGNTPLHTAAFHNREAALQLLIEHESKMEAQNNNGYTAFHIAALYDHKSAVYLLLEHGAEPSAQDKTGKTAFQLAVTRDNKEALRPLLGHQVDNGARDDRGWAALHFAAQIGDKAIFRQLLEEHKADKEIRTNEGATALHIAAGNGHEAIVQLLLELNADKEAQDKDGKTPMQIATETRYNAIVRPLT